ncbi:cilia- and flagella-associated protein 45-like [Mytilus edulis]|uniref:cilia- and flagella-associated protein 45-like n=1 Tax=Mytilus edulis TaxID=6550 RepID=UPI0039F111D1
MAKPININKANFTQLKAIKKIGETRALAIIAKREEDGLLNLDNLKEIPEAPQSLWTALLNEKIICFEDPEESDEGQEVLKNTIESLRHKILSVEKSRDDMAETFQTKIEKISEQSKAHIEEQRLMFEQQRDVYTKQKQEQIEQMKEMIKSQNEEIKDIHEYSKKIQTQLQQKETLLKVEKVIAEKEEKSSPVQLLKGKYNANDHKHSDYGGPTAPKMSTYDGRNDWRPYYLQFSTIADRCKWQSEQRLYKLIECLRDKALKFYSSRPKLVQTNYESLCKKMEERFGRKEPPHIVRRLLQDLKQEQEESLEEFAERAQELATDGYPDTPDNFVQTLATDAFLKGCVDKRAALTAMDKNPDALDQAVQYVRSAVANQKVIMGTRRAEIKRVSFMEQNDENEDTQETSVRAIMKSDEGTNKMNVFEKRLQKTEDDLLETKIMVKKVLSIVSQNMRSRSPQRTDRAFSPQRRYNSPARGNCYNCGEEGHFSRDCKKPRNSSPYRNRSPSPKALNDSGPRM